MVGLTSGSLGRSALEDDTQQEAEISWSVCSSREAGQTGKKASLSSEWSWELHDLPSPRPPCPALCHKQPRRSFSGGCSVEWLRISVELPELMNNISPTVSSRESAQQTEWDARSGGIRVVGGQLGNKGKKEPQKHGQVQPATALAAPTRPVVVASGCRVSNYSVTFWANNSKACGCKATLINL